MKRSGTSPVIGEFMLMVTVLVVGVPLIGYTFGNIGNFSHPAEVLVTSSSCSAAPELGTACNFALSNVGAGNTQTTPTVILYLHQGNLTRQSVTHSCLADQGTINAGSTYHLTCTFDLPPGNPGDQYSGSILLTNGASVPFIGRFS